MPATTTRTAINATVITKAKQAAMKGMPTCDVQIYADTTQGLQLRVQGKRAFWVLKYKQFTKTIGYVWPEKEWHLPSISGARDLVPHCKEVLDDNPKLIDSFLASHYGLGGTAKKAKEQMRVTPTTWTLQECADFMIERRMRQTSKDPIRKSYADEIRRTLRRPALANYLNKPAVLLETEVKTLTRAVEDQNGVSAALKFVGNLRAIFSYCAEHDSHQSGLSHKNPWWENWSSDLAKPQGTTRQPSIDDIAKTLHLAEKYSQMPLPWRKEDKVAVRPNVMAGLWWLVITAQRSYSGLHLLQRDLFPDPREPDTGWHLAMWAAHVMKAGRAFVLPIPPEAVDHMKALFREIKVGTETIWAFPSERGSDEKDICVDRNSVGAVIERLAGRDHHSRKQHEKALEKAQQTGVPLPDDYIAPYDLLAEAGISYWSPHDARRTLGDLLAAEGIPGGASVVLAHQIKIENDQVFDEKLSAAQRIEVQAQRVAKVTEQAYAAAGHIPLKKRAMKLWVSSLFEAYIRNSPIASQRIEEETKRVIDDFIKSDMAALVRNIDRAKASHDANVEEMNYRLALEQRELQKSKAEIAAKDVVAEIDIDSLRLHREAIVALKQMIDLSIQHPINRILDIAEKLKTDRDITLEKAVADIEAIYKRYHTPLDEDRQKQIDALMKPYLDTRRVFVHGTLDVTQFQAVVYHEYGLTVATTDAKGTQAELRKRLAEIADLDI